MSNGSEFDFSMKSSTHRSKKNNPMINMIKKKAHNRHKTLKENEFKLTDIKEKINVYKISDAKEKITGVTKDSTNCDEESQFFSHLKSTTVQEFRTAEKENKTQNDVINKSKYQSESKQKFDNHNTELVSDSRMTKEKKNYGGRTGGLMLKGYNWINSNKRAAKNSL